jgi:hypothetical protein
MPDVRCEGGASPLVRRQEFVDDDLSLVPGWMGEAALVEREINKAIDEVRASEGKRMDTNQS